MRTFITLVVIIVVVVGGVGLYLHLTTPHETAGVRFPLTSAERSMIASAPASAESFVYVPRAAALQSKLEGNLITRDVMAEWTSSRTMPRRWMLGNADLLAWQTGKTTRYLLHLDPIRAVLVRIYLMANGDNGGTILINAPTELPIAAADVATIESLAAKLPAGDALVVQRSSSRGAFPPIARPAVSSVGITEMEINITSRAKGSPGSAGVPLNARFARGAILSASFASAPALFNDLNRLFGSKVSDIVKDGGSISIYDVDTRKLLPRPLGVITLPAVGDRRPAAGLLAKAGGRTAEKDGELVIAFDDSIDTYTKDAIDASAIPGGRWAARIDAQRMAPILDDLREHVGLRIASPRLFRAARDLERWTASLRKAKTIEASDSTDGSEDELKVRITAK